MVPVPDGFLFPEIPFYSLEGEPVKFHGECGVETEFVWRGQVIGPQRAVRKECLRQLVAELFQGFVRGDGDKNHPRIAKKSVPADLVFRDLSLAAAYSCEIFYEFFFIIGRKRSGKSDMGDYLFVPEIKFLFQVVA